MEGEEVPNTTCVYTNGSSNSGDDQGNTSYHVTQPLQEPTKVWITSISVNPTVFPEYQAQVNVFAPNSHHLNCRVTVGGHMCDNDTTSHRLLIDRCVY